MGRLAALNENKRNTRKKLQFKLTLHFTDQEKQTTMLTEQVQKFQRLSNKLSKSVYFTYLNGAIILLSAIALIYDHEGITRATFRKLQAIDFFCTCYFFFELLVNSWGRGQKHFQKIINKFDTLVVLSQLALIIYLFAIDQNLVYSTDKYINLVKTLKIIRLIKLLWSAKIFYTISVLTRSAIQTLVKIREMVVLWIFLVVIVSLYGMELLSYRARFLYDSQGYPRTATDFKQAVPPTIHYENFGNALLASFNVFYNEEWHVSMFEHARMTNSSIPYFVLVILMGQVLFIRLLTAIFLNEFG